MDDKEINNLLEEFYPEARTTKGNKYSKSTLIGIRASLNRHLRNPPHRRNTVIMTAKEYSTSNRMLYAVLKDLKNEGLDKTKHYPAIREIDLDKIKEPGSFNLNDPKELQEKVFFDLQYNFGRRGRENIRSFTKNTFTCDRDDSGREFLEIAYNEKTKNHQHPGEMSTPKPRMYAHDSLDNCPIKSFKLYISKLDRNCDVLFTFPRLGKGFVPALRMCGTARNQ